MIVTGIYAAGTTTWTLPCSAVGMNAIYLSASFEGLAQKFLTPTTASGFTVTKTGDYSAGPVYIGRLFDMTVELSRVMRRDSNGQPDLSSFMAVRFIDAVYNNSGDLTVRCKKPRHVDRTKAANSNSDSALIDGRLRAFFPGDAKDTRLIFESGSHKPVTVSGVEIGCDVVGSLR